MSDDITSNLEEGGEAASRGLAGASVLMIAMTLLSAITGLGTSMALAWRFGKTLELDAYTQAFGIPDFFFFQIGRASCRERV